MKRLLILYFLFTARLNEIGSGDSIEPDFGAEIENVTVPQGREAKLSCIVDNLNGYKVRGQFSNHLFSPEYIFI